MLNKAGVCIITLLLTTISLATTCTSNDTTCDINQKKLQLMDKMGIESIKTKDQPTPKSIEKKPPQPLRFQIPKPGTPKTETNETKQTLKPQRNPGLKIFTPSVKKPQPQEPKTQPTVHPSTGIYR